MTLAQRRHQAPDLPLATATESDVTVNRQPVPCRPPPARYPDHAARNRSSGNSPALPVALYPAGCRRPFVLLASRCPTAWQNEGHVARALAASVIAFAVATVCVSPEAVADPPAGT